MFRPPSIELPDSETSISVQPLLDRARENQNHVADHVEMADFVRQVLNQSEQSDERISIYSDEDEDLEDILLHVGRDNIGAPTLFSSVSLYPSCVFRVF